MKRITLLLSLISTVIMNGGCSPLTAVSAVGSTVTNAAYNEAERRNRPSYVSPSQRAQNVADANLKLGIAYMQNGQLDKALEKLERARAAKDDHPQVYNALGLLYQNMGKDTAAEEYFKKALKIAPANSSILNNYGLLLCRNKRYAEAEDQFLRSAGNPLYQTPEIALTNAGTCALENRDLSSAETYFIQALNKNTNIPPALIQMAEINFDKGDYYNARKYLKRYNAISRHTPGSLWLGVQIEQRLGNRDTASSYALLLKNNFPDTEEAARLLEGGI